MPPTHTKKPAAMKMCAHGGPLQCDMGCYAEGGDVNSGKNRRNHEKGVHQNTHPLVNESGTSLSGEQVREGGKTNMHLAKEKHHRRLSELKSMPDPKLYAEGGDVEPLDEPMKDDGDEELEDSLAQELLQAMEKKDKRGVRDAIEALVLQCMNKGGM